MVSTGATMQQRSWALLSVTDKTGIADFAKSLSACGFGILSTGGTAKTLQQAGVKITEVAEHTGQAEILDGRVKTLHPKIHGGILADRTNPEHVAQCAELAIDAISVIAVNLYQFAAQAVAKQLPLAAAIEYVDVGGPAMIRAAAKNFANTLVVVDPADYPRVIDAIKNQQVTTELRHQLAAKAFALTAQYDRMIADYFAAQDQQKQSINLTAAMPLNLQRQQELRYGENPHQKAGWYFASDVAATGLRSATILHGKELSYNNLLDLHAATSLAREFAAPTVVIIKHCNPCGVCSDDRPLAEVFARALDADPTSAFGGIVALTDEVDRDVAAQIHQRFFECVIAPGFSDAALALLKQKANIRLLTLKDLSYKTRSAPTPQLDIRSIGDSILVQEADQTDLGFATWRTVSKKATNTAQQQEAQFAMRVCKHVKSNAIVLTHKRCTLAIGAGQMSRIDALRFAVQKAAELGKDLRGCTLASDAFFPFRDSVDAAAQAGVEIIVQPGGSMRDAESIAACDEHNIAMIFTGQRHFKH